MGDSENHLDDSASLAVQLLTAYVQHNLVPAENLPQLVLELRRALEASVRKSGGNPSGADDVAVVISSAAEASQPVPAVDVDQSVNDDFIISLEDGRPYRSLKRHLMARYKMTPEDYRRKWGLPDNYPMVAPSYARDRSEIAKRTGLGKSQSDDETSPPKRARQA